MSLDNVIAIAASAETAAAQVDLAHAVGHQGDAHHLRSRHQRAADRCRRAILMALLERYRVLVWGGGALLGWIAGDVMVTDPALRLAQRAACCTTCISGAGRSAR